MTISTRIAPGISVAALLLSLVVTPAAFAKDPMALDIDFRNRLSKDGGIKKDTTPIDSTKKDDGMKKDGLLQQRVLR